MVLLFLLHEQFENCWGVTLVLCNELHVIELQNKCISNLLQLMEWKKKRIKLVVDVGD